MTGQSATTRTAVEYIRRLRVNRGWTAQELADRCAASGGRWITAEVISTLERQKRRAITLDEVEVLCQVFDVSPELFLPSTSGRVTNLGAALHEATYLTEQE